MSGASWPMLDNVPEWDRFLTVDEQNEESRKLAAKYPDRVKLLELGPVSASKLRGGQHPHT